MQIFSFWWISVESFSNLWNLILQGSIGRTTFRSIPWKPCRHSHLCILFKIGILSTPSTRHFEILRIIWKRPSTGFSQEIQRYLFHLYRISETDLITELPKKIERKTTTSTFLRRIKYWKFLEGTTSESPSNILSKLLFSSNVPANHEFVGQTRPTLHQSHCCAILNIRTQFIQSFEVRLISSRYHFSDSPVSDPNHILGKRVALFCLAFNSNYHPSTIPVGQNIQEKFHGAIFESRSFIDILWRTIFLPFFIFISFTVFFFFSTCFIEFYFDQSPRV